MPTDAELQRAACSALLTQTAVEIIARQAREIHERDATIAKLKDHKTSLISTLEDMANEICDRKADASTVNARLAAALAELEQANAVIGGCRSDIVRFAEAERTIAALQESLQVKREENAELRRRLALTTEGAADMDSFALGLGRWK